MSYVILTLCLRLQKIKPMTITKITKLIEKSTPNTMAVTGTSDITEMEMIKLLSSENDKIVQ